MAYDGGHAGTVANGTVERRQCGTRVTLTSLNGCKGKLEVQKLQPYTYRIGGCVSPNRILEQHNLLRDSPDQVIDLKSDIVTNSQSIENI